MNINDEKELNALKEAIDNSLTVLAPFRRHRFDYLLEYVGAHYADMPGKKRIPVNGVKKAITTYSRHLAASNPQVMVGTKLRELRASALLFEMAINHLIEEIDFKQTMEELVINALVGIGIARVGLSGDIDEEENLANESGQPFVECISLDDWVHDTSVKRLENCEFMGHRYQLPLKFVQKSKLFKNTKELGPDSDRMRNTDGDETAETIGAGSNTTVKKLNEYVTLWDIYLPRDGQIVTLAAEESGKASSGLKPIRVIDWEGPEGGPYRFLRLGMVPDNIMPTPPISHLIDLHELQNMMMRKIGAKSKRQKTIGVVERGDDKDARRIMDANDGDVVAGSAGAIQEVTLSRPDPQEQLIMQQVKDLFSYYGGNIDSLAGLAQQGDTLGQEQLIAKSSSLLMQSMTENTTKFAIDIVKDLGLYLWEDPLIELPLVKRVPNTDIEVPVTFNEEAKEGDFLDYNLKLIPYSMQYVSPGELAQRLEHFMELMARHGQGMAVQGVVLDYTKVTRELLKLYQLDYLGDMIVYANPQSEDGQPPMVGEQNPKMAASTSREVIRRTAPGATEQGKSAVLQQMLMGANPQQSQVAALGRPSAPGLGMRQ